MLIFCIAKKSVGSVEFFCWFCGPNFKTISTKKVTDVTNYHAEFVMLAMLSVENQRIYLLSEVRILLSEKQAAEGSNQFIC